jgi:hypothetical protein
VIPVELMTITVVLVIPVELMTIAVVVVCIMYVNKSSPIQITCNTDLDIDYTCKIFILVTTIMKRKFKQRWSSIPPVSPKRR